MSHYLMQYTWYLILFFCIDQGDGRWKERDRDTFKDDIKLYRKIAEKIEREIEAFYDETSKETTTAARGDRIQHKYATTALNANTEFEPIEHSNERKLNFSYIDSNNMSRPSKLKIPSQDNELNDSNASPLEWPKFEDLLLAIGKKYDWRTDRWIKMKAKRKANANHVNNSKSKILDNNTENHEKHQFKYRIVKLKSKNRRSVVVAVSAVR